MIGSALGAFDGAVLQSATISAVGTGTVINTTGQRSLAITVATTGPCQITIQGSNDQTTWQPLLLVQPDTLDIIDYITTAGNYSLKVTSLYVQYSCTLLNSNVTFTVVGRMADGASSADRLAQLMDAGSGQTLQVSLNPAIKTDSNKSLILSDAPLPLYFYGPVGETYTIDTMGYESFTVTTGVGFTATVNTSNDQRNWNTLYGTNQAIATPASSLTATAMFQFPIIGRYIQVVITAPGSGAMGYLRSTPGQPVGTDPSVNLVLINGNAPVSAGANGMLAVGGNTAAGVAPTANPVSVGGVDSGGLARRILTDTTGRVQINGPMTMPATAIPGLNFFNNGSSAVQDVAQQDGETILDVLVGIRTELQVLTKLMYESYFGTLNDTDEPPILRQDPTSL